MDGLSRGRRVGEVEWRKEKSGKIEYMKKSNVGILEVKTKEGKFYLSVVVDKDSRYVLGHSFGTEKDKDHLISPHRFPLKKKVFFNSQYI